jgi:alcohol dehydrogenase class IV
MRSHNIEAVVAVGGGSVIDTGKAVSVMLTEKSPVIEMLEGVGTGRKPLGSKKPFIAVPTTAGTGSEATKNAVLSRIGKNGFKKSLRHANYVPDLALIDPELTLTCGPDVTASCGMDALCQLIESFVSTKASPITDALSISGISFMKKGLLEAFNNPNDINARSCTAYAAMLSGITLANAGLGIVHGIASALGGFFNIPHGVICGTLLAPATKINIEGLHQANNTKMLEKFAQIGQILSGHSLEKIDFCTRFLVDELYRMQDIMNLPRLKEYGFSENDLQKVIKSVSQKNNPANLNEEQINEIIKERI